MAGRGVKFIGRLLLMYAMALAGQVNAAALEDVDKLNIEAVRLYPHGQIHRRRSAFWPFRRQLSRLCRTIPRSDIITE
jgi:hypothetical protein